MSDINKKAITDLADLLKKLDLGEIEYKADDFQVKIVAKGMNMPSPAPIIPVQTTPTEPVQATKKELPKKSVNSPMVGVVYLAPDPEEPTFVSLGSTVRKGQTLCLIEAMKTFNPIKATADGKIKEILVESGTPVEFNQPLFVLE